MQAPRSLSQIPHEGNNFITGDLANSAELLKGQLDPGGYVDLRPYSETCGVFISEAGRYCDNPNIVAAFEANRGLRTIYACEEHERLLLGALRFLIAIPSKS